ncbi:glycoside hydrolase family 13 protein [Actinomyces weissii]|uniref:Glycoside hydrolase family 13 protein n=1 Tax=Actinomyces weissii TaxID=675090 RepID=A0A7T7S2G4_9ACTO|nr:glycoside hydrolase family 13 protein [Actinomyces weissii]QQM67409.1 glycoside hydrolase family 13 protein [Actinomyces weissii]
MRPARPWWQDAVVYQVYPRSFADADGNGTGDLRGLASRVPYLQALGVDAVWLSPFYPSALADGGYDVDDHRGVDPRIGTLADFDQMVTALHEAGIRVLVDLVPNHTSNRHQWFRAALAGGPDAPERALYHFREGRGEHGQEPPNDWRSLFGGPLWQRVDDRDEAGRPLTGPGTGRPYQWYLHIFAPEQPDLNWEHPQVRADLLRTLRFWCDRGVDGFRVDVALGMVKDLSQLGRPWSEVGYWPLPADGTHPLFDRDAVHGLLATWRELLESYEPPRFAVAEAGVQPSRRAAYARSLGQAFNFQMQDADWTAESYAWALDAGLEDLARCGSTTWVLGCHDVFRVATRYGFEPSALSAAEVVDAAAVAGPDQAHDAVDGSVPAGRSLVLSRQWVLAGGGAGAGAAGVSGGTSEAETAGGGEGLGAAAGGGEGLGAAAGGAASACCAVPVQDAAAGRRRARAAALVVMALPGSLYVYQGDELGLPEVPDIPEERLQDPIARRNRALEKGRDGCRVPLPWARGGSSYGFGPDGGAEPHLPQPPGWGGFSVEAQEGDSESVLSLYREGLRLRRGLWVGAGEVTWLRRDGQALGFARGGLQCWVAFGAPLRLPAGEVLLASAPVTDGLLPADATAWLRA